MSAVPQTTVSQNVRTPTPVVDILPNVQTLQQAAKLAMAQDKPIQLDYYVDSSNGKAFLGEEKETHEKRLVKSAVEYTSVIEKTYKVQQTVQDKVLADYIMVSANSIYIISTNIVKRTIEASFLRSDDSDNE